jgi:hypothetical protein
MRIKFRGKEYEEVEKPNFAELAFIEKKFQTDIKDLFQYQNVIATFYISIKRADPGLLTWEELLTCTDDDFEFVADAPEITEPDQAELPQEQWPLDPTGAVTQTAPPSGYGQSQLPTYPNSPYFGENTSGI